MITGDFNKFIKYLALLLFIRFKIAFTHYIGIFMDAL